MTGQRSNVSSPLPSTKEWNQVPIVDPDQTNTVAPEVRLVHVFADGHDGGNPAPIVANATGMTSQQMQDIARDHGFESGFILPPPAGTDYDYSLRFWMPNHEVSMCGHATVGAVWLLGELGWLDQDELKIETPSGPVYAQISGGRARTSQPTGELEPVAPDAVPEILGALGITEDQLASRPIVNATTSRTKTLVPLRDPAVLDSLRPDFARIEGACERADSTGLYPWAPSAPDQLVFDARQFPRSSKIELRLNPAGGLWLGGNVQ